jgi:hypothetical protein
MKELYTIQEKDRYNLQIRQRVEQVLIFLSFVNAELKPIIVSH